jgi:hypothetical protein
VRPMLSRNNSGLVGVLIICQRIPLELYGPTSDPRRVRLSCDTLKVATEVRDLAHEPVSLVRGAIRLLDSLCAASANVR